MQKLTETHHPPTVDRALRLFILRAKARPETTGFALQATNVRLQLRDKRDIYNDALDERIALSAEIGYRDTRIDRFVLVDLKRDAATITAPMTKNDGAAYGRKLFQGVAPSIGMRPVAGESQGQYVATIIQRIQTDVEYAPLGDHAVKLTEEQQEIDAVTGRRKDAYVRETMARSDLDAITDQARRFYNQLHPQLQLLFPDDPALVESYFLDLRKNTAGEDADAGATGEKPA